MSWEDDLNKKYGLNKNLEIQEAEEKRRRLAAQLATEFASACRELEKAQIILSKAGKSLSLNLQGNHVTLSYSYGTQSLAVKMGQDGNSFEILEDGVAADKVSTFFHGDMIVLDSAKNQPVDIHSVLGKYIKRLDGRVP